MLKNNLFVFRENYAASRWPQFKDLFVWDCAKWWVANSRCLPIACLLAQKNLIWDRWIYAEQKWIVCVFMHYLQLSKVNEWIKNQPFSLIHLICLRDPHTNCHKSHKYSVWHSNRKYMSRYQWTESKRNDKSSYNNIIYAYWYFFTHERRCSVQWAQVKGVTQSYADADLIYFY